MAQIDVEVVVHSCEQYLSVGQHFENFDRHTIIRLQTVQTLAYLRASSAITSVAPSTAKKVGFGCWAVASW